MDPYCKFIFGKQEKVSKLSEDGGLTPKWKDELFEFKRIN
jgi:hypothetical protein